MWYSKQLQVSLSPSLNIICPSFKKENFGFQIGCPHYVKWHLPLALCWILSEFYDFVVRDPISQVNAENIAICLPIYILFSCLHKPIYYYCVYPLQGISLRMVTLFPAPGMTHDWFSTIILSLVPFGSGYFMYCQMTKYWSMQLETLLVNFHEKFSYYKRDVQAHILSSFLNTVMSDSGTAAAILSPWEKTYYKIEKLCLYFISL